MTTARREKESRRVLREEKGKAREKRTWRKKKRVSGAPPGAQEEAGSTKKGSGPFGSGQRSSRKKGESRISHFAWKKKGRGTSKSVATPKRSVRRPALRGRRYQKGGDSG